MVVDLLVSLFCPFRVFGCFGLDTAGKVDLTRSLRVLWVRVEEGRELNKLLFFSRERLDEDTPCFCNHVTAGYVWPRCLYSTDSVGFRFPARRQSAR